MKQDITSQEIEGWSKELGQFPAYTVARNAATASGVRAAARNPIPFREYHDTYSVSLSPTGEVTNQKASGRCWIFATMNVLRDRMMSEMGTKSFELSQAYVQFYDKLEKANLFLENVISRAGEPLEDRYNTLWFDSPVPDGGWWDMACALVEKYGVVPKECMPDSANACATSDMNELLNRKVRQDGLELREAIAAGATPEEVGAKKQAMLGEVYRMLCVALGEPPARFSYEYVADARPEAKADGAEQEGTPEALAAKKAAGAQDARLVRLEDVTPQEFFKRFFPEKLSDWVSLGHVPGATRPFGSILQLDNSGSVAGVPIRMLNVPIDVLKTGVIEQLKAGHPAWFACDVCKLLDRTDKAGLLDTESIDAQGLFGVEFSMTKEQSYDTRETVLNHAMTFQGVDLTTSGEPRAWRVENSWGKEKCHDGYFIMTDRYFDAYVGQVIVHRDYLPADVVAAWESPETPVVHMEPWSPMFGVSD